MWLLFGQIFTFILLVATFVYLRSASAVLRSLLPKTITSEMGLRLTATLYVVPSVLVGGALYLAHARGGVIWISITAIYLSWGLDLMYVSGMVYYYLVLRRIRKQRASFELLIRLQEYTAWPSGDVVRKPLDYLVPRLPFASRWKKTAVLIKPIDFHRFLNGDVRLIDEAELGVVGMSYPEFCSVPHFSLPRQQMSAPAQSDFDKPSAGLNRTDQTRSLDWDILRGLPERLPTIIARTWKNLGFEPPQLDRRSDFEKWRAARMNEEPKSRRKIFVRTRDLKAKSDTSATRYYIANRALHSELTEDLWNTSRRLCETPPFVIARTWKSFHFQESLRLRFVALFNTADLIQRLVGSIALCCLRERGALVDGKLGTEEFRVPLATTHWTRALELALQVSDVGGMDVLRRALLLPRDDHIEWQERLRPFSGVLGGPILFSSNNRHALAGLKVLVTLRDKIIGHGGVGSHLKLQPLLYLSTVHYLFLNVMREVAPMDLGIFLGNSNDLSVILAKDQGLAFPVRVPGDHPAFVRRPDGQALVPLYPYLRYYEGRLLIINRFTPKEGVNYIDYNVANIFEPSFITLKTDWNDFIKPRCH